MMNLFPKYGSIFTTLHSKYPFPFTQMNYYRADSIPLTTIVVVAESFHFKTNHKIFASFNQCAPILLESKFRINYVNHIVDVG